MTNEHSGKTVRCTNDLTDENGDPVLEETETIDPRPDAEPVVRTIEVPEMCGRELTFDEHGTFEPRPSSPDARRMFEGAVLRFDCPDCGGRVWMCPVCSDPDEHTPAGWFYGEASDETIPCHNCNMAEVGRQRREGY